MVRVIGRVRLQLLPSSLVDFPVNNIRTENGRLPRPDPRFKPTLIITLSLRRKHASHITVCACASSTAVPGTPGEVHHPALLLKVQG